MANLANMPLSFLFLRLDCHPSRSPDREVDLDAPITKFLRLLDTKECTQQLAERIPSLGHVYFHFHWAEQPDMLWQVTRSSTDTGGILQDRIEVLHVAEGFDAQVVKDSPFSKQRRFGQFGRGGCHGRLSSRPQFPLAVPDDFLDSDSDDMLF